MKKNCLIIATIAATACVLLFALIVIYSQFSLKIERLEEKIDAMRTARRDAVATLSFAEERIETLESRVQVIQELTLNNTTALYGKGGMPPAEMTRIRKELEPGRIWLIPEVGE